MSRRPAPRRRAGAPARSRPARPARTALLAALLLGACARKPPTAPPAAGPPPPALVASLPAPFATGVLYDTDIWAQFDRPLDPATVDSLGVHFKLDTVREPVTIRYDAVTRRVSLTPRFTLQLQRTYTVEFTPRVRGTDGTPLPAGVFFQFTTNSLRRTTYAYPAEDAIEGPLSALGWGGNGPPVATIAYDVYVGTDSALVDTRQVPPQPRTPFVQLLPAARWPLGAVLYWAVTAVQLQTGERLNGALRRFRTLPADTPVDSLTLAVGAWGGASRTNASLQRCSLDAIFSGPDFTAGVEWNLAPLPAGARLAAARLVLHTAPAYATHLDAAAPQVFAPQNPWLACACGFPGPPYHDPTGFLADGLRGPDSLAVQFASDRLAAFFEAEETGLLSGGTTFASNQAFEYFMSVGTAPYAVVTYYRSGP